MGFELNTHLKTKKMLPFEKEREKELQAFRRDFFRIEEEEELRLKPNIVDLLDWAFVRGNKFAYLSNLAEPENWGYRYNSSDPIDELGVLKRYLKYTFKRLQHEQDLMYGIARRKAEQKIVLEGNLCAFNTGLSHRDSGKPIYALFEPNTFKPENRDPQPWYLKYFCVPGQGWEEGLEGRLLSDNFGKLPAAAKYECLPFDANADFDYDYNLEHIVHDGIEKDRYPHPFIEKYGGGFCRERYEEAKEEAKRTGYKEEEPKNGYLKEVAKRLDDDDALFQKFVNRRNDAIRRALDKARSNDKIVVPQYYIRYDQVSFLLPLALMDDTKIDAVLAVQSYESKRFHRNQGYTIFTPSMAYTNARLIEKPTSDWLSPKKILGQ